MKIKCLYDKIISIEELKSKFHPKNRNTHPQEQIERLAAILNYQGARYPAKISNQSQFMTSGHGRVLAAELNGWEGYPVNFQDYDDEDQEYADVQADNAIASWAELDFSGINSDIGSLGPDFDVNMLGIKNFSVEPADKLEPGCDEDDIPEHIDPITKPGDCYRLGNHRLLCGDSTSIDAVEKLMNGEKADMVFTDPPYGMKLDTDYSSMGDSGKKHNKIIGDHEDFTPELISNIFASFPTAREVFTWGADYYAELLPDRNNGSWIVWDKRSNENEIGKMDGQFGSSFELCWSKRKHKRDIARIARPTSFWRGDERSVHPSQKPVSLCEWFLQQWGSETKTVSDLFGGSGSTLIACEKTNRRCFMMELDPHYCDVIVARWEKYTGRKAELLNDHS